MAEAADSIPGSRLPRLAGTKLVWMPSTLSDESVLLHHRTHEQEVELSSSGTLLTIGLPRAQQIQRDSGAISCCITSQLNRPFAVRGECSAVMGVHAAVLAALRNRIRVL